MQTDSRAMDSDLNLDDWKHLEGQVIVPDSSDAKNVGPGVNIQMKY